MAQFIFPVHIFHLADSSKKKKKNKTKHIHWQYVAGIINLSFLSSFLNDFNSLHGSAVCCHACVCSCVETPSSVTWYQFHHIPVTRTPQADGPAASHGLEGENTALALHAVLWVIIHFLICHPGSSDTAETTHSGSFWVPRSLRLQFVWKCKERSSLGGGSLKTPTSSHLELRLSTCFGVWEAARTCHWSISKYKIFHLLCTHPWVCGSYCLSVFPFFPSCGQLLSHHCHLHWFICHIKFVWALQCASNPRFLRFDKMRPYAVDMAPIRCFRRIILNQLYWWWCTTSHVFHICTVESK